MSQQHTPNAGVLSPEDSAPRPASNAAVGRIRVVFVGTGPGPTSLLTIAARRDVAEADVIIADADQAGLLTSDELTPSAHTRIIQVAGGSAAIDPAAVQAPETVEEAVTGSEATKGAEPAGMQTVLTVEDMAGALDAALASMPRTIVRLLPGDPLRDPRIAAEVASVRALGLGVDMVPGIPVDVGVADLAGVSAADGMISEVTFRPGMATDALPTSGSVLVWCASTDVGALVAAVEAAGRGGTERVLLTVHGGTPLQRTKSLTLSRLAHAVERLDPKVEQVLVVLGPAARRNPQLDWFESKPLAGWRVLLPTTREPSRAMLRRLSQYGGTYQEVPTMQVEPPRNPQPMEKAIHGIVDGRFGWMVLTSEHAARAILEKLASYGLDARAFSGLRIAAIGPATERILRRWGIRPDLMPAGEQTSQALVAEFPAYDDLLDPIDRVLVPRADIATDALDTGLTELGWEVEEVTAYRTVRSAPPDAETREAIKTGRFDAVLFTSSSTVRNLVGIAGKPHALTVVAAIGPATAQTCDELGLRVDVQADQPDPVVLVNALADFAAQRAAQLRARGEDVTRPSQKRRRRAQHEN